LLCILIFFINFTSLLLSQFPNKSTGQTSGSPVFQLLQIDTAGGNTPLLNEGGRLLDSLPHVLSDGPITKFSVPPEINSSWVIQGRYNGLPFNVADWI